MSATYEVRFARAAERDLRDIYDYVVHELGEPRAATRLAARFREVSERLATFPHRNRLMDEEPWRSRNTRYAIIGHYLMFYLVSDEERVVHIIRIMYGGRDVKAQLARLLGGTAASEADTVARRTESDE